MTADEFVQRFRNEKAEAMKTYCAQDGRSSVSAQIAAMGLSTEQLGQIGAVINTVLTDTYYTVLLALDGCTTLGGMQENFIVRDSNGNILCSGDGELEALAYEYFHGSKNAADA